MSSLEVALSATRVEACPLIIPNQTRRHDLAAAQRAAKAVEPQIGASCARRALVLLGETDPKLARRHILKLFRALVPGDFAHIEAMQQRAGRPLYGDVYGRRDAHGLWFIKLTFDGSTQTVIMSCHEAEHPIRLANGTLLKARNS